MASPIECRRPPQPGQSWLAEAQEALHDLFLRASAYRYLDALELAGDDVARALSREPDNPDGLLERGILRRLAGDPAGARQDWLRAIALGEGTPGPTWGT